MASWKSHNPNSNYSIISHNSPYLIKPGQDSIQIILMSIINCCQKEHTLSTTYTNYLQSINKRLISSNLINNLQELLTKIHSKN